MVVVIRDVRNLVKTDFSSSNDFMEVYFDANADDTIDLNAANRAAGKCGITQAANNIKYFNVRMKVSVSNGNIRIMGNFFTYLINVFVSVRG